MGCKHEFHREPVEHLLHVSGRRAQRFQFGDPGSQRFAERFGVQAALSFTEHADALPVFGNVGKIEKDAECPCHDGGLLLVERLDPGRERRFRVVASLAALAGQTADLLDEGVGLRAGEFLDHGSEHFA